MKIRPLVIDDKATQEVHRVLMHARQRANWYLVSGTRAGSPPPGDDPRYSATEGLFRHLSVSVNTNQPGLYPGIEAVWEIARLFGFTGPAPTDKPEESSWAFNVQKSEHCVVVAQRIEEPLS